MIQTKQADFEVVVVDAELQDYAELLPELERRGFLTQSAASARAAVQVATRGAGVLWIVNVRLPDADGFDLFEQIRSRSPQATVFLIGDRYAIEDELRSRKLGAALYACKPPCVAWFLQWRRAAAVRLRNSFST